MPRPEVVNLIGASTLNDQLQVYKETRQRLSVLVGIGRLNGLNEVLSKELKKEEDLRNDIDSKIKKLKETITTAQTEITLLDNKINDNKNQITRILSTYKINKEASDESLKTIAGITQPLNENGKLVPNISVLGFKGVSDETSITAAQFKLFVAPTSADKNFLNSTYRLFIPEASS